jgi:hypothetical protein
MLPVEVPNSQDSRDQGGSAATINRPLGRPLYPWMTMRLGGNYSGRNTQRNNALLDATLR